MGENLDKAKGRVKQAAGDLTDDDRLKNEGKADELAGKVKGAVDTLRDKAEDAIDKVKDKARPQLAASKVQRRRRDLPITPVPRVRGGVSVGPWPPTRATTVRRSSRSSSRRRTRPSRWCASASGWPAALADLTDAEWAAPSRCDGWSVQDVVAHLAGVNGFWALSITKGREGEPTRYLTRFDPVDTPAQMVEAARVPARSSPWRALARDRNIAVIAAPIST